MSATALQRATDEGRRDCAPSELTTALARCRHAFLGIGLISGMINLLTLTGSLFMLEIYDRVLPSRSVPTLVGLAAIAFSLYAFQGVLDVLRGRVLVRVGTSLDETLIRRVFDLVVRLPLSAKPEGDGLQPVRDLDRVRGFLSGLGPTALFDLPWMPLYIAICFLFHPWIGATALVGALLLVSLTFVTELRARKPTRAAVKAGAVRTALAEASRRNAEVLQAMGMGTRMASLWGDANASYMSLAAAGVGRRRRSWRGIEGDAPRASIERAGSRRLSCDRAAGDRRRDDREFDPDLARACSGRARDRQLARLCRRPPKLEAADGTVCRPSGARSTDGAAASGVDLLGRERHRGPARNRAHRRAGRDLFAQSGQRSSASSARAPPASPRSLVCSSACGNRRAARCASTEPPSSNGIRMRSAAISAICRRTWSCSPAPSPRISRGSTPRPIRRPSSPPRARHACMT